MAGCMALSVLAPSVQISAKSGRGFDIIAYDDDGNEYDVETLTSDRNGGWGMTISVDVDDDVEWYAYSNKKWIGLEDEGLKRIPAERNEYLIDDAEFQVYISKNRTKSPRSGKITFYNRDIGKSIYIVVQQSGK